MARSTTLIREQFFFSFEEIIRAENTPIFIRDKGFAELLFISSGFLVLED